MSYDAYADFVAKEQCAGMRGESPTLPAVRTPSAIQSTTPVDDFPAPPVVQTATPYPISPACDDSANPIGQAAVMLVNAASQAYTESQGKCTAANDQLKQQIMNDKNASNEEKCRLITQLERDCIANEHRRYGGYVGITLLFLGGLAGICWLLDD